ncbi:MAG TPA: hypothetical protein PKA05_04205 [Roseiflexaceae bacterium]|nr:hypothetical protein [Roseiflexaceae bacterium]HMP39562.1 hypothetical protein [Roseiflexaceae bacterium]
MYYRDLDHWDAIPVATAVPLLAVGWLRAGAPMPCGPINPAVVDRIAELLATEEGLLTSLSVDSCPFCAMPIAPISYKGMRISMNNGRLVIPDATCCYVAPAMIMHLIVDHNYLPPARFCEAVLRCPPRRSTEYRQAIEQHWQQPINW